MKMVLTLCILILGQVAHAANVGDMDSEPVKPVTPPKGTVINTPTSTKPANAKTDDDIKVTTCASKQDTDSVTEVKAMFNSVLDVPGNFPFRLGSEKPTEQGPATILVSGTRTVSVSIHLPQSQMGPMVIPTTTRFCKLSANSILADVESTHGRFKIVISKVSDVKVYMVDSGKKFEGNFGVKAAK